MKTTFIYALKELKPGEYFSTRIRYVGKANDPYKRFQEHCQTKVKCHRGNWIRSLPSKDLSLQLEVIEEVSDTDWKFWEREYIRLFRALGFDLVNEADGGEGGATMLGKKLTPKHCAAISAALLGRKQAEEHKQKNQELQWQRPKRKNCSSSYRGVSRELKKWRADIFLRNKSIRLGLFLSELDAARAYDAAVKIHRGSSALLNFP